MRIPVLLVVFLLSLATPAVAQDPWEGWVGPPADGLWGLRFGMDRVTVDARLQEIGLRQAHARTGTMRHAGHLEDRSLEVVTLYHEDARGERLYRIQVRWDDLQGPPEKSIRLFDRWDQWLQERYGWPLLESGAGSGLLTGSGASLRLYQGPEMQAILELKSPRPGRIDMALILDHPQLHPDLPGSR